MLPRIFTTRVSGWFSVVLAACALAFAAASPAAAGYPDRPIRLIVTVAPGGFLDIATRKIGQQLETQLGQSVVVENKPGAGTILGTDAVAKAAPDGYTLWFGTSTISLSQVLYKTKRFDPVADFVPIGAVATFPLVLLSNEQTAVKNFKEFVALAKSSKAPLNYAAPGKNVAMLNFELLKHLAGIDLTFIPYQGGSQQVTAALRNDVQVYMDIPLSQRDFIASGKLVPIGVTSKERSPLMPEVPTIAESGYPNFVAEFWVGILAPAGIPPDVLAKLRTALKAAASDPEIQTWLRGQGYTPADMTPDQLREKIVEEIARYREIATIANIAPE